MTRLAPRLAAIAAGLALSIVAVAATAGPGTSLTIYRDGAYGAFGGLGYGGAPQAPGGGHAVVVERRAFDLAAGDNAIELAGVARDVDPASVQWRSVTDPGGASVVEQRFAYDLATPDALLDRQVGGEVVVATSGGEVRGTLVAYDAGRLVIETADARFPVRVLERSAVQGVQLAARAGGVVTRPTLRWRIAARKAGRHEAEVTYRTGGLEWTADYAAVLDRSGALELSGWASIGNATGVEFKDARLALVSGGDAPRAMAVTTGFVTGTPFVTPPRVYPLERATTLPGRGAVQLELFAPIAAARTREVVVYEALPNLNYYATGYPNTDCYAWQYQPVKPQADRVLEVTGKAGMPDGRVRVYRRAADGALALVGDDLATPDDDGRLRVRIGTTDELKGERRQVECQPDPSGRAMSEKIELKVTNTGGKARRVVVRELMQRWSNWAITTESVAGKRAGAAAQEYVLDLPAGGTRTLTYTVQYTW